MSVCLSQKIFPGQKHCSRLKGFDLRINFTPLRRPLYMSHVYLAFQVHKIEELSLFRVKEAPGDDVNVWGEGCFPCPSPAAELHFLA